MTDQKSRGRDLFIVDNSVSGWTALRYLEEWSDRWSVRKHLVGSSNFSVPGLTKNVELNVQIQSAREVAQLQEWFEAHWKEATDVTDSIVEAITRHVRLYTPFDVYAKALQEFFRGHELTATEWDET